MYIIEQNAYWQDGRKREILFQTMNKKIAIQKFEEYKVETEQSGCPLRVTLYKKTKKTCQIILTNDPYYI